MDKKQQEAKIIRIATELFPFVQQKNTACAEFLTLRAKLTDAVWRWALLTFNPEKIENAAIEIMECVNRSVLSHEGTAEHYINYLAHSLKQEINNPDASVGVCCSHKVVAVGFNTLLLRRRASGY